jgi:hypothetical protein
MMLLEAVAPQKPAPVSDDSEITFLRDSKRRWTRAAFFSGALLFSGLSLAGAAAITSLTTKTASCEGAQQDDIQICGNQNTTAYKIEADLAALGVITGLGGCMLSVPIISDIEVDIGKALRRRPK